MPRHRNTGPTIQTREQMEELVGQVRTATIERDALVCRKNAALQRLDESYDPQIDLLQQRIDELVLIGRQWGDANPAEFGARKSIDMRHGSVGFRTGTPKLKPLSGWTWARVLDRLQAVRSKYVRAKYEVAKEKIIADRDLIPAEELRASGIRIVQDESFFIEPRMEEPA